MIKVKKQGLTKKVDFLAVDIWSKILKYTNKKQKKRIADTQDIFNHHEK